LTSLSLVLACAAGLGGVTPPQTRQTLTADQLFQMRKVWTVHLTLPNDAFNALTPTLPPPPPPPPMPPPPPPGAAVRPAQPSEGPVLPAMGSPEMQALERQLIRGQFVAAEGARNGISGSKGIDFEYLHASLDIDTMHFDDVAVRPKGNGTYNPVLTGKVQKPSLKIDLNKYVKGQKLAGVSTINLHNSIFDASFMNEPLAFQLYRDAGVPAPRTAYARVYVTAKGGEARRYIGLYQLVENVDEDFTESRFKVAGGALFKPVTILPFHFISRDWADYNQMYDPKTDLTAADKQRVMDFSDLLTNGTDAVLAARIGEFIDLDAFAKYMAVVVWMGNPDSVLEQGQNYYVHLNPTTKKFAFLPWDQDHSWGQFEPWRTPESQQKLDIMQPWVDRFGGAPPQFAELAARLQNHLLVRTFKLEPFKRSYLAALSSIARTLTQPARIAKQVDDLAPLLAPIVAQEPKEGRAIMWDQAIGEGAFKRPFNPASPDIPSIKVFVPARQASVLAQLKAQGIQ